MLHRFNTRRSRAVIAAIAVGAALVPVSAASMEARSATATTTQEPNHLDVAVPYLGSANTQLPAGWAAVACPFGQAPDLVAVRCEDNRVTFTAADYAQDLAAQPVTIGASVGGVEQSVTYTVTLTGPRLAAPVAFEYGYPVAQGTRATIAYSELRTGCDACTDTGPTFVAESVTPSGAGELLFSATGLVFHAAPDFSGAAQLAFSVRDRFGQVSDATSIGVTVVPGRSRAPAVVEDTVTVDGGQRAFGNALTNDVQQSEVASILLSCGEPGNGTVTCDEDGAYVYTPDEGFLGVDEFSYHLFTRATGDQVAGTVLVGAGTPLEAALDVPTAAEATPRIHQARTRPAGPVGVFGALYAAAARLWGAS